MCMDLIGLLNYTWCLHEPTRMHSSRMRTTCDSSCPWRGGRSASVHAGIHNPPWVSAWRLPWVWAWRPIPPRCGPGDPPGCGPGDPPGQTPQLPPWVWAWRPPMQGMLGYHLQGMLGYHLQCILGYAEGMMHSVPPVDRILDTLFWKYYLAPNFVCGR